MKKLYTFLFWLLIASFANAQNPVPNPGLENWSGTPLSPDNWISSNATGFVPITQVSGHSGFAARGDVLNYMGNIVAPNLTLSNLSNSFTQWFNSVQFYYKTNLLSGDEFIANALIYNSSFSLVGLGVSLITTNASGFTLGAFSIDSVGTTGPPPYSVQLSFLIGGGPNPNPSIGSYFVVDDVELSAAIVSGTKEIRGQNNIARIFPLPAKDFVTIKIFEKNLTVNKIILRNMLGQVVMTDNGSMIHQGEAKIDLTNLPGGIYFAELSANEKNYTYKVVKEE